MTGRLDSGARLQAPAAGQRRAFQAHAERIVTFRERSRPIRLVAQDAGPSTRQRGFDPRIGRHGPTDGRYRVYETRNGGSLPPGAATALAATTRPRPRNGRRPSEGRFVEVRLLAGAPQGPSDSLARRAHIPSPRANSVQFRALQRRRRWERHAPHTRFSRAFDSLRRHSYSSLVQRHGRSPLKR